MINIQKGLNSLYYKVGIGLTSIAAFLHEYFSKGDPQLPEPLPTPPDHKGNGFGFWGKLRYLSLLAITLWRQRRNPLPPANQPPPVAHPIQVDIFHGGTNLYRKISGNQSLT